MTDPIDANEMTVVGETILAGPVVEHTIIAAPPVGDETIAVGGTAPITGSAAVAPAMTDPVIRPHATPKPPPDRPRYRPRQIPDPPVQMEISEGPEALRGDAMQMPSVTASSRRSAWASLLVWIVVSLASGVGAVALTRLLLTG